MELSWSKAGPGSLGEVDCGEQQAGGMQLLNDGYNSEYRKQSMLWLAKITGAKALRINKSSDEPEQSSCSWWFGKMKITLFEGVVNAPSPCILLSGMNCSGAGILLISGGCWCFKEGKLMFGLNIQYVHLFAGELWLLFSRKWFVTLWYQLGVDLPCCLILSFSS